MPDAGETAVLRAQSSGAAASLPSLRFGPGGALPQLAGLNLTVETLVAFQAQIDAARGKLNQPRMTVVAKKAATEQLAAMDMMAIDPISRVIAPRFMAAVLSLPLLAVIFSSAGVIGAYLIGVELIGIDSGAFWSQMSASVDFRMDVLNGLVKALVFGVAVGLIAVFEGYHAAPTAEGVANATTRTVVIASLSVLALDFILTVLMFRGLT
jgi:phospholipid/cholesterol/gamma-HCH transport system permease protein